jgi:hypothetical protein
MTNRDPHSEFEDEGIPDLQDGFPEQQWAEDPQQAPLPGDEPIAVDDFGTTAEEQRTGESLDGRLSREEPDPALATEPAGGPTGEEDGTRRAGRLVEEDEGVRADTEKDAVAEDVGPDGGGMSAEEQAMRVEGGN